MADPTGRGGDDVGGYYDRLDRWNRLARPFGYGGGRGAFTVHRPLSDPRADGRPTVTRIHDLILESLPPLDQPRLLDAGCGLGGTLLDLVPRLGGTGVGLTSSSAHVLAARRALVQHGLASRIEIVVGNYDDPPDGPFDLVVAIESLAHSRDPARTLPALGRVLSPGGVVVIVDDMPEAAAATSNDLASFKAGWGCPVLWSAARYHEALRGLDMATIAGRDLSGECRPRALRLIERLLWLNRLAHRAVPFAGWRAVMDSHRGGLALERLYRHGLMRYWMLMARGRPQAAAPPA